MRVVVNPETQPSGHFGYVEAGQYRLRVVKVTQEKRKEYPYLKWEFEHTDPNVKATDPKKQLGKVYDNTTLKPSAQFRLCDLCLALGVTWGDFDTDTLIGTEFDAKLKLDNYEDTISNKVLKYIPVK